MHRRGLIPLVQCEKDSNFPTFFNEDANQTFIEEFIGEWYSAEKIIHQTGTNDKE